MLGLLAFLSMPVMMAASRGTASALAAVAGQALLVALPVFLLRKRLHPADAVAWERSLPVPPGLGWRGDWLVAGRLVGWMAGACALSATLWLYQWPAWLQPVWLRSLGALAASIALGWTLGAAILAARRLRLHQRGIPHISGLQPGADGACTRGAVALPANSLASQAGYAARPLRPRYLALWHRLFWLPFWRAENAVGIQQCALLLAALAAAVTWATHTLPLPRAALGLFTSLALVLLVDRGDKAAREQAAAMALPLAMWPLARRPLLLAARTFTLLPALLVHAVALETRHAGLVRAVLPHFDQSIDREQVQLRQAVGLRMLAKHAGDQRGIGPRQRQDEQWLRHQALPAKPSTKGTSKHFSCMIGPWPK